MHYIEVEKEGETKAGKESFG